MLTYYFEYFTTHALASSFVFKMVSPLQYVGHCKLDLEQ